MIARELLLLLRLVTRLQDRVLYEIATTPANLLPDYEDRVIVAVARGERQRRNTE